MLICLCLVPEESEGKPVDESSTTEPERQVAPTRGWCD